MDPITGLIGVGALLALATATAMKISMRKTLEKKLNKGLRDVFKNSRLGIFPQGKKPELPKFDKIEKTDKGLFAYFSVPKGIGVKQFNERKEVIEQYLGCTIKISRTETQIKMQIWLMDLPDLIKYDYTMIKSYLDTKNWIIPIILGYFDDKVLGFDLAGIPSHLSIGGTTGGGKSTLVRTIITTIACFTTPKNVHLIIIDHKEGVEAMLYEGLPHVKAISENTDQTLAVLKWAVEAMKKRYNFIKENRCLSIESYNEIGAVRIPHLVIVVDELGDLNPEEATADRSPDSEKGKRSQIHALLSQISRKGRAAGIHLIPATQRPDGYVMPKQIQNNIAGRVAFFCAEEYSSETILGLGHTEACSIPADKPGRGIYRLGDLLVNFQGFLLTDEESEELMLKHAGLCNDPRNLKTTEIDLLSSDIPYSRAYKD